MAALFRASERSQKHTIEMESKSSERAQGKSGQARFLIEKGLALQLAFVEK